MSSKFIGKDLLNCVVHGSKHHFVVKAEVFFEHQPVFTRHNCNLGE